MAVKHSFVILSGRRGVAEDSVALNKEATVFQAEPVAIQRAADFIDKNAVQMGFKLSMLRSSLTACRGCRHWTR